MLNAEAVHLLTRMSRLILQVHYIDPGQYRRSYLLATNVLQNVSRFRGVKRQTTVNILTCRHLILLAGETLFHSVRGKFHDI